MEVKLRTEQLVSVGRGDKCFLDSHGAWSRNFRRASSELQFKTVETHLKSLMHSTSVSRFRTEMRKVTCARSEGLIAVTVKTAVFWDASERYLRFGKTCCLLRQGRRTKQRAHEDGGGASYSCETFVRCICCFIRSRTQNYSKLERHLRTLTPRKMFLEPARFEIADSVRVDDFGLWWERCRLTWQCPDLLTLLHVVSGGTVG